MIFAMIVNPWQAGVLGKIGPYLPCGRVERSLGNAIACGLISILKLLLGESLDFRNAITIRHESNTGTFYRVGYTQSVTGAIATGWYARLWRAVKGTIKVNARHARGVRTDLQSCQNYQLVLPILFVS